MSLLKDMPRTEAFFDGLEHRLEELVGITYFGGVGFSGLASLYFKTPSYFMGWVLGGLVLIFGLAGLHTLYGYLTELIRPELKEQRIRKYCESRRPRGKTK